MDAVVIGSGFEMDLKLSLKIKKLILDIFNILFFKGTANMHAGFLSQTVGATCRRIGEEIVL